MNINRVNNGVPPQGGAEAHAEPAPNAAAAPPEAAELPVTQPADGLPTVSRAALHGPRQAEILQSSLLALLDRASDSLGALPAPSRQVCAEMLAADPFLSARLLSYLEQKAN